MACPRMEQRRAQADPATPWAMSSQPMVAIAKLVQPRSKERENGGVDQPRSIAVRLSREKEQENVTGAPTHVAANLFSSGSLRQGIKFSRVLGFFFFFQSLGFLVVCSTHLYK